MKSSEKDPRLSYRVSHERCRGSSTTALPTFLTKTSSPSKRNPLGSLTAWLLPFMNNFAVSIVASLLIYTCSIDQLGHRVDGPLRPRVSPVAALVGVRDVGCNHRCSRDKLERRAGTHAVQCYKAV